MECIVVGSKDCSILDVWTILCDGDTIKDKWSDFALHLGISSLNMSKLRQDQFLEKINLNDALDKILHIWIGQQGSDAKLAKLIYVIEEKCVDNYVGEKLRLFYNLPCKNFQNTWDSLSFAFEKKVAENISDFFPNIATGTVKSRLEGEILLDLMTGKMPKLFKSTIPPSPAFYLKRTILPRHTISVKVLEAEAPDIFLFTGINEFELRELGRGQVASSSGKQLDSSEIHARFIVLDQTNHFKQICKRAKAPVHLMSYDSGCGSLKWIKSCGQINLLQNFLDQIKDQLPEKEFLHSLEGKSSNPILLSDSPGMGKTFLLAHIAMELEKAAAGKKIITFTSATDFIKKVKLNFVHENILDSVKLTLQNLICENELGILEFSNIFSATNVKIELFLDGFDEVGINDNAFALEIIKSIANNSKSIRLWITTRPHHLEELEAELNVLGYNIKEFDENDQINLLITHWQNSKTAQEEKDVDHQKIKDYACKVLRSMKSKLNKDDNDIAGIPLQCRLIAEVFEEECIGFASESNSKSFPSIRINSISDLYENMIAAKFKKYIATKGKAGFPGLDSLFYAHVDLSLKLLFPDYNLKLNYAEVSIDDLLGIGVIEKTTMGFTEFIHRTFAEYFVAGYVVEQVKKRELICDEFANFFIDKILTRDKHYLKFLSNSDEITSFKFVHDVIVYFINTNISFGNATPQQLSIEKGVEMEIFHACANNSFLQIFRLFFNKNYSTLDETIVLLAIRNSTCEYFKFVIFCIGESIKSFDQQCLSNFLRVAVQRSELEIISFLLKNKEVDFQNLIENVNDTTKLLMHDCVSNTKYKLGSEIEKRVGIIKLLWKINRDLIEAKDACGRTPLLCEYAHVDLLKELIRLGADVTSKDMSGDTVLHLSKNPPRQLNAQEYNSLLSSIPKSKLAHVLNVTSNDGHIPLYRLLCFVDPTEETLRVLFPSEKKWAQEMFKVAIISGRNSHTLINLIKLGVDVFYKQEGDVSYLHYASSFGNLDALKLLVVEYGFDVNTEDDHRQTPMDYAIISKQTNRFETAKALHNFGGKLSEHVSLIQQRLLNRAIKDGNADSVRIIREVLNCESVNLAQSKIEGNENFHLPEEQFKLLVKDFDGRNTTECSKYPGGWSLLHVAAAKGNELAVKELVDKGADLNATDINGNTPLHAATLSLDLNIGIRIIKFLIDKGANANANNVSSRTFLIFLFLRPSQVSSINPSQLHEIAEYLAGKNLLNLVFSVSGEQGFTPLQFACAKLEPEERTILLLKEKGISFNVLDNDGRNALMHAIYGGQSTTFINLLINKFNAEWNLRDKYGNSCLHAAAGRGHFEALKLLLGLGLDVNNVNEFGMTPLHSFARFGNKNVLETARILVDFEVDASKKDYKGHTALETFLQRKDDNQFDCDIRAKCVELLKIGTINTESNVSNAPVVASSSPTSSAKSDEQNKELIPLLHKAVIETNDTSDCLNIIKSLIPTETDIYAKDSEGSTFLHKFLFLKKSPQEFHEISKYLLNLGYKGLFETAAGVKGTSALQLSVLLLEPKLETLQLFKSHEINFNCLDAQGNTLMWYAITGGRRPEFLSLLLNGFEVSWRRTNNMKQNLLHVAAKNGNVNALNLFVNLSLDINSKDLNGLTPIHYATMFGRDDVQKKLQLLAGNGANCDETNSPLYREDSDIAIEVIKCLVKNGAETNSIDYKGNTPFHFAIRQSSQGLSIINCLLDNGAKIDSLNFNSTSYIHLAAQYGKEKVLKLFLDMKILDVNAVNLDGDTALHCAMQQIESDYVLEKARLLLECGADANSKNNQGQAALDIANDRDEWDDELKNKLKYLFTLS